MGDELKRIAHMPKTFIERICWVFVLIWGYVAAQFWYSHCHYISLREKSWSQIKYKNIIRT